jgi:hypothetical protein
MSGTAKTTAALLTEQPDNAAGRILAQEMRNLTVSGPQWAAIGSVPAPGILRGCLDVADYLPRNGAVLGTGQSGTQRATNATVLQAAFDTAAANGKFLEWPASTVEIANSAGITMSTSNYDSFRLIGSTHSILSQYQANAPILTIGDTSATPTSIGGVNVSGIALRYGVDQSASTSGIALSLGALAYCIIENIHIGQGFSLPYIGVRVGNASGSCPFFSNIVRNVIVVSGGANSLFSFTGFASGNLFQNCYFNNAIATGTGSGTVTNPFVFSNGFLVSETVFEMCNVEWVTANQVMQINQGNATFLSCHWEGIVMTGGYPRLWDLNGGDNCNIQVIGGESVNVTFNSGSPYSVTGDPCLVMDNDGSSLVMIGHHLTTNAGVAVANNVPFSVYLRQPFATPPASRGGFSLDSFRTTTFESFLSIDDTLPSGTYGAFRMVDGYRAVRAWARCRSTIISNPANNAVIYGSMGSEVSVIYNTALTGNLVLVLGTNMMASGAAGQNTARPVGDQIQVIRESSATGAFTITVKNATTGGTTLGTFSTSSFGTAQTFGFTGAAWTASP